MEFVPILLVLILWIVFGIIAAVIASEKGRSGCGGFALGVLLGPFGILWALLMRRDQANIDDTALKSGEMKKCPACTELVRVEATKCRHCGEDLNI